MSRFGTPLTIVSMSPSPPPPRTRARHLLALLGVTTAELADHVGVSIRTVNGYLAGHRTLPSTFAAKLAELVGHESAADVVGLIPGRPLQRYASRTSAAVTELRRAGVRVQQIADEMGTTDSTVSRWLSGARQAPPELRRAIVALAGDAAAPVIAAIPEWSDRP